MIITDKKIDKVEETIYFLLVGTLLAIIWCFPSIITIDGSIHAMNARLIVDLLTGQCPLTSRIVEFNPLLLPNWTGHAIMAALIYVGISVQHAEMFVFTLGIFLLCLGLRQLASITKKNLSISWFGPALAFNQMTMGGNYNFMISLGIFLLTVTYYLNNRHAQKIKFYIILSLLLLLAWFSHILGFLFIGTFILVYEILYLYNIQKKQDESHHKIILKEILALWPIGISFIPSLVLTGFYTKQNFQSYKFMEGNGWTILNGKIMQIISMADFNQFISHPNVILKAIYACVAVFFFLYLFVAMMKKKCDRLFTAFFCTGASFWLIALFSSQSYLGGWMLAFRLIIAGWYMMIIALGFANWKKSQQYFIASVALALCIFNFSLYYAYMNGSLSFIEEATRRVPAIEDNTIIYSLNFPSPPHLSIWGGFYPGNITVRSIGNILTADKKCIVSLDNYEAALDTFPLRFKHPKKLMPMTGLPFYFTKTQSFSNNTINISDFDPKGFERVTGEKLNYIFLWGNEKKSFPPYHRFPLANQYFEENFPLFRAKLRDLVKKDYNLVYEGFSTSSSQLRILKRNAD